MKKYENGEWIIAKRRKKELKLKVRGMKDDIIFCVDDEGRAYTILESEVQKKG